MVLAAWYKLWNSFTKPTQWHIINVWPKEIFDWISHFASISTIGTAESSVQTHWLSTFVLFCLHVKLSMLKLNKNNGMKYSEWRQTGLFNCLNYLQVDEVTRNDTRRNIICFLFAKFKLQNIGRIRATNKWSSFNHFSFDVDFLSTAQTKNEATLSSLSKMSW